MNNNHRAIISDCVRYYEIKHQIDNLKRQADDLKQTILKRTKKGKYGRYTIYAVESATIHVRSYTRSGYRAIRQTSVR